MLAIYILKAAGESAFHFKPVKKKLDCSRSNQLLF